MPKWRAVGDLLLNGNAIWGVCCGEALLGCGFARLHVVRRGGFSCVILMV